MNIAAGAVKGYYEIGLTYINHRVKVRVFNKETFSDLVDRLLCILSIDKEDRFIALKQENSEKLIYNNDELVPEDFYQLVFVDNGINKPKELIAEEEKIEKSKSEPFKSEEPGNARAKKGTNDSRNKKYFGFSLNQGYLKAKRDKDTTKILYCPFLSGLKDFTETGNLKTHMRTHTGERPFVCHMEDGGKSFITKGHLKTHLLIHSGEKPFTGNYQDGNKSYSRSGRLKIHQRTHTGLKPYVCSFGGCGKRFTEKGNLKTHSRIHSGEKPYVGSYDDGNKSFTTQGHLTDHKKRHSGDKPYHCEACSRRFIRSSTLKKHQSKFNVSNLKS